MNTQLGVESDEAPRQRLAYSVEEAAGILSIGRTLGWAMVRSGELRSVRLHGRVIVPRDAIEDLLRDGGR